jgi:hypothetical protein
MGFSKAYFENLNREDYELNGGVPWCKFRGVWDEGKLVGTDITKEEMSRVKSVPEDYWEDYIELMSFCYSGKNTDAQCREKIKEIEGRGRIKMGVFQWVSI